jgi:HAD superfamily hydrolase (TIGR01509 family)
MRSKLAIALNNEVAMIEAIIFDMDGVLSDTQPIHSRVESDLLRQYGIELSPEEITREFAGVTGEEMFPRIFSRSGKPVDDLGKVIERKWLMVEEASRGNVLPIPGALDLVAAFRERGLPLAVASASRHSYIEMALRELGLSESFNAIVSSDDVAHGKPAPDVFLLAAKRLGVAPQSCLVIEDGVSGMRAAKSAGMYCIGLVSSDGDRADLPANLLVKSLREICAHFRS